MADGLKQPGASAPRLMGVQIVEVLAILCLRHIFNGRCQVILGVNTVLIASHGPNRTFTKYAPTFPQPWCAIRLPLIASRLAGCILGGHHMNVIASSVLCPRMPTPVMTMPLDLILDNDSHVSIKCHDGMLQPILPPSLE